MKKIFSLLAVVFMTMGMFAEPVTLTFKDWGDTTPKSATDSTPKNQAGDDGTAYTTANIKDSIEGSEFLGTVTEATKLYAARVGYGCKLGTSKLTGKFVANLATPAQFDSIVFVASSYSASEGSVKVCGGEVIDLTNGGTENKVLKRLVYVPTGTVDSISFETTAKRAYLKSIIFYPATDSTGGNQPSDPEEYVVEGYIAGTLAPQGAALANGMASASNRGGFIVKEDGVFFANGATGFMKKMDLGLTTLTDETDSIGKGLYMDLDEAGHIIIYSWTSGSGTKDIAQVYNADYTLVRNDTLNINGRCDMPHAVGNMVQGRGAYFTASNGATSVLRHNVVDGVKTTVDTIPVPVTLGSTNSVSALDVDHFYVQSRGNALLYIDMSGAAPVVTNISYFSPSLFTSCHGGQIFQFAGHTLYVMGTYKVGQYLGSFAVYDVTDPANVYLVAEERTTAGTSGMGTSCVTFRVVVDGQTAHIYEYACYNVRKYDLTVVPVCYMKQGNEGAEWLSMKATTNGFELEGIYLADSLYINNAMADEGATKFTRANITYNGTVAVNDTVRFTYNNGVMTIDSLGHFVPTVTFNVLVPDSTPSCFIAGNFNNWSFTRMAQLTDSTYTYTYRAEDAIAANMQYKYVAGADWQYVEKAADGAEIQNRTWAANDTVRRWAAVPVVNVITYELNGGVTNDYGWTSKGAICLDLMHDYNTAYGKSLAWAKWEDGVVYYHCGKNADETPIWLTETAAAGQNCTVGGFIQAVTYNETNNLKNLILTTNAAKYSWLGDVINANRANQNLGLDEKSMVENTYRKELSAFFLASASESNWPASSDFTSTAGPDFFYPIWGHALSNPETVTGTFTLNEPYKEGFTFDGWYTSADFSGAKVTTIDENTPSCTLYAKWIEYIPTLAEVKAMADNTNTKASGVVTYINKQNVYVQDATGGLLLYMNAAPTFKVGDKVVVRGTKVMYGGAPELKFGEEVSAEPSTLPAAKKIDSFEAACTEANLFTRVSFMGLKITSLDSYKNPYVTDGVDTLQCYRMSVDSTFKVGDKVNVTAILGFFDKYQLVGDVAGIEHVATGVKDQYNYPARGANGEYTLENKWVISVVEDNYEANKPGVTGFVRGMVAKDGIMYFINRTYGSLVRVNAATGAMLDPLPITGEHLFEALDSTDNTYKVAVTNTFNDIKLDGAGNCLIGACVTGSQHFMIYKVDLTTGAATLLIDEKLVDNDDFATIADDGSRSWGGRFDAFGVYGDVNSDAIVMAADANSFYAYKWTITNGVAGAAEQIDCALEPSSDQSLLIKDGAVSVTAFGTAPQIFPVDADYFYVDGWNTLPMLYDMDGTLSDDFINCPSGVNVVNNEGDTCKMNTGHNGLCEFQVGDEYFMVMAATNTAVNHPSAFALYKFADASKSFAGLEPLWYFPANGMGSATNGFRTAVPSVEVNGTKATIYLYAGDNGYAVYEFTGKEAGGSVDIENIYENTEAGNVTKIIENGQVYIIKNGVRYNVLGTTVEK